MEDSVFMNVIPLVTAFGLGSLITAIVQWYITTQFAVKKRQYDERKEAYEVRRMRDIERRSIAEISRLFKVSTNTIRRA